MTNTSSMKTILTVTDTPAILSLDVEPRSVAGDVVTVLISSVSICVVVVEDERVTDSWALFRQFHLQLSVCVSVYGYSNLKFAEI